jgi:hypothetical protein
MENNIFVHMGIRSSVSRNNLSNANKVRDWRIYADLAYSLIQSAHNLYVNESFSLELENTVYALDATNKTQLSGNKTKLPYFLILV